MCVGSERPTLRFGLFKGHAIRLARPINNFIMAFAAHLLIGLSTDALKSIDDTLDAVIGVQDEDAISGAIDQRVETLLFEDHLAIQARIEDRNGSLVGKGL